MSGTCTYTHTTVCIAQPTPTAMLTRNLQVLNNSLTGPCLRTRVPYAHLQTDAHAHPFAY